MVSKIQKMSFEADGFLVVPSVLAPDLLTELRAEAESLSRSEPTDVGRRVWHERVLFRRLAFRKLLDSPLLIEAETALLGEDVQLLALDLLLTRPGQGEIAWHRDIGFVCNKTLSINTGIYLQDMTEDVGPLRVVPGSHRWENFPPGAGPIEGEITVPVNAGDAVLFYAGLWHTGDKNQSDQDHLAVFPYFGKYWIKRMDNYFTQPLPADLLQTADPVKRQLLGLGLRPGVGSYHGDDECYNRRGEAGLDFPMNRP